MPVPSHVQDLVPPDAERLAAPPRRTIPSLLAAHAARAPGATAVEAPGRTPLTYAALGGHLGAVAAALAARGIGAGGVVATMVPNGPDALTAFLGVASASVAVAPLDPAARGEEVGFVLRDVGAGALLLSSALDAATRAAAHRAAEGWGVRVIGLHARPTAGRFALDGDALDGDASDDAAAASPDDVALLLHTSGTTARPKLVPLTHANLLASAAHIAAALELTSADRSLGVAPLFHVSGLVSASLAALHAGGSVVSTPGFSPADFPAWLEELRPTWYTAAPAVHQAVLAALASRGAPPRHALRVVRSFAAPLPPRLASEIERVLGAPMVDSYGLTETASGVTGTPPRFGARKHGSVGVAAGPEVVCLDDAGRPLPPGEIGEVAVRGPNVTSGYAGNAAAALTADGWFRTGDDGYLDADGYLYLVGRRREIINRGGEKVSPHEVEAVLLAHPAVEQAVTFAVAHATLGEDVVAAVVPRAGVAPDERELRAYVADRVAASRVPRRVLVTDALPVGPSGKVRRRELGAHFAPLLAGPEPAAVDEPHLGSPVAEIMTLLWAEVLGAPPRSAAESFFAAGGDSLRMMQLVTRLADVLGVELAVHQFFEDPTFGAVVAAAEALLSAAERDA